MRSDHRVGLCLRRLTLDCLPKRPPGCLGYWYPRLPVRGDHIGLPLRKQTRCPRRPPGGVGGPPWAARVRLVSCTRESRWAQVGLRTAPRTGPSGAC